MSVADERLEYMQREQSDDKQCDPGPPRQDPNNQEGEQDSVPECVATAHRPRHRGLLACSRQNEPAHNNKNIALGAPVRAGIGKS